MDFVKAVAFGITTTVFILVGVIIVMALTSPTLELTGTVTDIGDGVVYIDGEEFSTFGTDTTFVKNCTYKIVYRDYTESILWFTNSKEITDVMVVECETERI